MLEYVFNEVENDDDETEGNQHVETFCTSALLGSLCEYDTVHDGISFAW